MACIKIDISNELLDTIEEYLCENDKPNFSTLIEGMIERLKNKALEYEKSESTRNQNEETESGKKQREEDDSAKNHGEEPSRKIHSSTKITMQKVIDEAYVLCQKAIKGNSKYANKLYPRACQMIADVSVTLLDGQLRHRSSQKEMEVKTMLNRLYKRLEPKIKWEKLKGIPLTEEERIYDIGDQ